MMLYKDGYILESLYEVKGYEFLKIIQSEPNGIKLIIMFNDQLIHDEVISTIYENEQDIYRNIQMSVDKIRRKIDDFISLETPKDKAINLLKNNRLY